MQPHELQGLLHRAHESERGIRIRTSSPQLLRNKLYALMREYPALAGLGIITPPVNSDTHIWLVKKEQP